MERRTNHDLIIHDPQQKAYLLDNLSKFPTKLHESFDYQHNPRSSNNDDIDAYCDKDEQQTINCSTLSPINFDSSIQQIQRTTNIKISAYERSNKKQAEEAAAKSKKKASLAVELARRLKAREERIRKKKELQEPEYRPVKTIDWKTSKLKEKVDQGQFLFNPDNDTNIYREEEIEYMINMLKYNAKDFAETHLMIPIF